VSTTTYSVVGRRLTWAAAADHSVARCIRGTPSNATKNLGKGPSRGDPGAHSGGVEAMRCLDHTRGRYGTFTVRCVVLTYPPESTTIALLARLSGLMEPLREFVKTKAVWGTCAGAVLLSQAVSNPKKGGQELLGGVSVTTTRNGWGSQVTSSSSRPPSCLGITKIQY
jgi:SNO glutamine amidotransferase family protein